uniref:Family with sequence similarity 110 member C n=1 Tax=Sparus aurata TaxID=8175 RepID=A0A671XDB8_SPAAU
EHSKLASETKGRMSAVERLAASKVKYVKSQQVVNTTQEPVISLGSASVSSTGSSNRRQVRRSSSKKRPDSLMLYRQKCELLRGSTNDRKHHITRKLLLKNAPLPEAADKEREAEGNKEKITTPEGMAKECSLHAKSAGLLAVPDIERRTGTGVSRSHSDISSRYSKNFADFDAFFKYCGLEGDVIKSLGRENFSARSDEIAINLRSVSVSTSDDCFSRSSGDSDGLLENELHGKIRQGTSVIERNARIIKWLYSCKNAKDTGKRLRDLD